MKFGHRLAGNIERYDDTGRGVFQDENGTFAIPFTAVGDSMTATFVRREKGMKLARLESVASAGPDRVPSLCPHAGVCGGCLWQHLSYDAQLKLKMEMINRAFERTGHEERISIAEPALEHFRHRNRMDYVVGWNGEIGLKEYGSWNRYVDLKTCLLLNEGVGEILQRVRGWMKESDLQPWDAKFYTGDVRYVVIREGKNTNQRMIIVVVKDASRITDVMKQRLISLLSATIDAPSATSVLLGEQSLITDISLSQTFETLVGDPWLEEDVNGIQYRIHPNSFFQTNTRMAGKVQEVVASHIPLDAKRILDLYCGLGFFGIFLAKNLASPINIHGVEIDTEAIELAKHNALTNGVADRCTFTAAKAEDMSWKEIPADVAILDPPRAGLHPRVLKTVIEKQPETIVYVSCNYKRLVEELKEFKNAYRIEHLTALDLFPHTPHVEVVVKLVRTNVNKNDMLKP